MKVGYLLCELKAAIRQKTLAYKHDCDTAEDQSGGVKLNDLDLVLYKIITFPYKPISSPDCFPELLISVQKRKNMKKQPLYI